MDYEGRHDRLNGAGLSGQGVARSGCSGKGVAEVRVERRGVLTLLAGRSGNPSLTDLLMMLLMFTLILLLIFIQLILYCGCYVTVEEPSLILSLLCTSKYNKKYNKM